MWELDQFESISSQHWRTDAFELRSWRRLLIVPWTARRSNQSILKEIVCVLCVSCSVMSDSLQPHEMYSLSGSSVHGIFQAKILEWVAISFSRESFQPKTRIWVSSIRVRFSPLWATKEALNIHWKDWCWSWSYNTLATWCEKPSHWKRPWCWERLKAGEGSYWGWDSWYMIWMRWHH